MKTPQSVTPESPISDQIRFLDDFLREGARSREPDPSTATRIEALRRMRTIIAKARARIAADIDF